MAFKLTVLLSYKAHVPRARPVTVYESHEHQKTLSLMTHIFRLNFWSLFETISIYPVQQPAALLFGMPATISNLIVCKTKAQIPGQRPPESDYIVSAVFSSDDDRLPDVQKDWMVGKAINEITTYFSTLLGDASGVQLLEEFNAEHVGFSSHVSPALAPNSDEHLAIIAAYYHLGWLLLLRLEREQIQIRLFSNPDNVLYSSDDIVRQRIGLIEVQRRFLTFDRAYALDLQEYCDSLRVKYKMETRFKHLQSILVSFESHLDNSSKLQQLRKTWAVSKTLNILTFSSIPLAIFGALLTVDLTSSVFQRPSDMVTFIPLYMVVAVSFLIPAALLVMAITVDSFLRRRRE